MARKRDVPAEFVEMLDSICSEDRHGRGAFATDNRDDFADLLADCDEEYYYGELDSLVNTPFATRVHLQIHPTLQNNSQLAIMCKLA